MIQGAGMRRVSQMRIATASNTTTGDNQRGQRRRTSDEGRE